MPHASQVEPLFAALREVAAPAEVAAIEDAVLNASDRDLCRINALAFAARRGLDEEKTIAALLHACRLGIFDLAWNILCPGCGGVLDSGASLKIVHRAEYTCALCAAGYQPTLDEMVEVTFTVSPRVRQIAAHDPHSLPPWEYRRQIFWCSGVDLPDDAALAPLAEKIVLDEVELMPGERAVLSLNLPVGFIIIFDAVVHMAQFIEVDGEPTTERRNLSFVLLNENTPTSTIKLQPGPVRLSLENRAGTRTLPGVWVAGEELHNLLGNRRPFLTANRLLTNQTFRDLYKADTIDVDQRLKITSLTFLFTDLKGSTELYDRVGDLAAYEIVRAHFGLLHDIVAEENGAVVKTIGDAVMATFLTPDRALRAALRMRDAIAGLGGDLLLKIGMHEGGCLAVVLNERQDYFGQSVNIAARVQGLATTRSIYATERVVEHPVASALLQEQAIAPIPQEHALRGIASRLLVYEIP